MQWWCINDYICECCTVSIGVAWPSEVRGVPCIVVFVVVCVWWGLRCAVRWVVALRVGNDAFRSRALVHLFSCREP